MRTPATLITSAAAACMLIVCKPVAQEHDGYRTEFMTACEGLNAYRTMQPAKRGAYCACTYDRTLQGLSAEEKQFARFYLLAQSGLDVQSRRLIDKPEAKAMFVASQAIANAVQRCRSG